MDSSECNILACPVEAPSCETALHSILSCANIIEVDDDFDKRLAGVTFAPDSCGRAYVWQEGCTRNDDCEPVCIDEEGVETPLVKHVDGACDPQVAAPFIVYGSFKCNTSTYGSNLELYQNKALRALELGLAKAIETYLWTGVSAPNKEGDEEESATPCISPCANYFTHPDVPIIECEETKGACAGLSELIQHLANCGPGMRGMIHAPAWAVNLWLSCGLIDCVTVQREGLGPVERLQTKIGGHCVVAGGGYTGCGPEGVEKACDETFIYATRCMDLYMGRPFAQQQTLEQMIDHRTNTVVAFAEQVVVAAFDNCCTAGIKIKLC